MERGAIPIESFPGGFDLQSTLESGQTYRWDRDDGNTYDRTGAFGGSAWYHTVVDDEFVRARQVDGHLEWRATTDAVPLLTRLLRLEDDLDAIIDATPAEPLIDEAYETYRGMRIVRDPFFPCLVSFICSAQMRVERIYEMQHKLARAYGREHTVDGRTYHAFPEPADLAGVSETALRELKLGYRAPYVKASAAMLAEGDLDPEALPEEYEAAREALTALVGVGDKVADCVLLFSRGYLEAVPLDTWIRTAIDEYYPDCDRGSYAETSRAIRQRFGPYAGYAQTYVFHHLRHSF